MMERIMPTNIPNYTSIEPNQLDQRPLNIEEQELVRKFIKKEKSEDIVLFLFWLFFSSLITYSFINSKDYDIGSILMVLFMDSPIIILIIKHFLLSKPCKYIKIGVLHGIWSIRRLGKNDTEYFYVAFQDSQTYIKEVNCLYKEFRRAEENDRVLVFSLDGKKAYGCLLK